MSKRIIQKFGGIRPMAATLRCPVSTVQYWSDKDAIPLKRVPAVIAAAQREGFDVTLEECLNVQPEPAA